MGFWGWGRPPARLVPRPARVPPSSEAASRDVVPDPSSEAGMGASSREGLPRGAVRWVSSLPFEMLARRSVALTLCLAGSRASGPPKAQGPACSPPFDPRPSVCFPATAVGVGLELFSHVGDGEEQALLREGTPASHSRAAGLHKPGAPSHMRKLLTGRGAPSDSTRPPRKPLPRLLSHSGTCLRPQQSRHPGVGCFSRRGDPGCS